MSAMRKPGKGGFRMKSLPEDAYKGQQQRLKQNLIQKAKLKKQYAKVLKREGLSSTATDPDITREQPRGSTQPAKEFTSGLDSFTNFAEEDESDTSQQDHQEEPYKKKSWSTAQPAKSSKSYRQRARERKTDSSAIKATEIRSDRDKDRQVTAENRTEIEKKRSERVAIRKRELSRTKKGQPLMKDRMQNILSKLRSEAS